MTVLLRATNNPNRANFTVLYALSYTCAHGPYIYSYSFCSWYLYTILRHSLPEARNHNDLCVYLVKWHAANRTNHLCDFWLPKAVWTDANRVNCNFSYFRKARKRDERRIKDIIGNWWQWGWPTHTLTHLFPNNLILYGKDNIQHHYKYTLPCSINTTPTPSHTETFPIVDWLQTSAFEIL